MDGTRRRKRTRMTEEETWESYQVLSAVVARHNGKEFIPTLISDAKAPAFDLQPAPRAPKVQPWDPSATGEPVGLRKRGTVAPYVPAQKPASREQPARRERWGGGG